MLELRNLSIEFGKGASRVQAVKGISLSIAKGETVALVGESGSGKSVTGMALTRLLPEPPAVYAGGEILFEGRNVLGMNARELRALDVPASEVRHPAVFGPLGRSKPLAVHEMDFVKTLTDKPVKVALPGPYLLTRTMWMECISDRAYQDREALATDVVRVLREELASLLAAGVALVQFDEPVLSEVVFSGSVSKRSFMCGALSEKNETPAELGFAQELINAVVAGFPRERIALHMCRGNWTPDEGAALSGDYTPLIQTLSGLKVGSLLLELCTPRAGEMEILRAIPDDVRIGVGICNQKHAHIESLDEILSKGERAIQLFGKERVLFTPDCGFATFADNPLASEQIAEKKLNIIAAASTILRQRHGLSV
jgi:5-methyltetrahydropteroyltriglutamate--homocysteine methyltransferase